MAQDTKLEKNTQDKKAANRDYISAIGRRKSSRALIRLYKSDAVVAGITIHKGEIFVNNKSALEYFGRDKELIYKEPLNITGSKDFSVSVKASGGGKMGQLDATVLGIARALDKLDREKFHTSLKKKGFLTRDPRVRERRKVGMGGKARRRKQSPKR